MSDLISRETLIKVVEADINRCYAIRIDGVGALSHFIDQIKEQPTVEAVPVVHGEWLDNGEKDVYGISKPFAISCSICGSSAGTSWMNFCPNCGSDMRKKVQDGKID